MTSRRINPPPPDRVLVRLRQAYGMQLKAADILEQQAQRLEDYPEMQARIREHVVTTRRQVKRVASCIKRLGGDLATHDADAPVPGTMAALTHAMAENEVVKNALADYVFERYEITSYRSLIAAAEATGDEETAQVCREILEEKESMASWVSDQIPLIATTYLNRDPAGVQAGRQRPDDARAVPEVPVNRRYKQTRKINPT